MIDAYKRAMAQYATFTGRDTRRQYWLFMLAVTAILITALFLDAVFAAGYTLIDTPMFWLATLAHVLPGIAASVRRLHDTDKSGWWYALNALPFGAIVVIILQCLPSTDGPNRFGPPATDDDLRAAPNAYRQVHDADLAPTAWGPSSRVEPTTATARPATPAEDVATPAPRQATAFSLATVEQLERLAALRASGALDEQEFAAMKSKLLRRV